MADTQDKPSELEAIRAELRAGDLNDADCVALANRLDAALDTLRAEVEALKSADEESCAVVDKLARLLAEIAVTLKGPEPDMTRWSYHDLPQLVAETKERAEKAEAALAEIEAAPTATVRGKVGELAYINVSHSLSGKRVKILEVG